MADTGMPQKIKDLEAEIEKSKFYINNFFVLSDETKSYLKTLTPQFGFGEFGSIVYHRTYSRKKEDGTSEEWVDTIIRVTEGIISIRKDHMIKNRLSWNDREWQLFGRNFAESMFKMEFLPPGRGLWACGSNFVYQKGGAGCNNCGVSSTEDLILGSCWTMDMLMCGVGVGSDTIWKGQCINPNKQDNYRHEVGDSREGWVESVKALLLAYIPAIKHDLDGLFSKLPKEINSQLDNFLVGKFPIFDYSKVRPEGTPIKGFGGTASGPGPLIKLHQRIEVYLDTYLDHKNKLPNDQVFANLMDRLRKIEYSYMDQDEYQKLKDQICELAKKHPDIKVYNEVRCVVDILNAIGACVVAGNIRRSSELIMGSPGDLVFLNLKNRQINPERESISWMSNNTVRFEKTEEFSNYIPDIAERIRDNGEPGFYNLLNVQRYGRVGRYHHPNNKWTREFEEDAASLANPCITADTKILTDKGWREVKDLINKPFTAVVQGKSFPSTEKGFWLTGFKGVYELILQNGMTLKCTVDHEIFTLRGKVKLIDLTKEDEIIINDNINYNWSESSLTEMVTNMSINQLSRDKFEGYMCGQLIGDGTFGSKKVDGDLQPIIDLWIDNKYVKFEDYEPYRYLQDCFTEYFSKGTFKGFHISAKGNSWTKVRATSVNFISIADKYGIKAIEKKVYEKGSKDFSIGLLRGFFDADGTVIGNQNKGVNVRLAQINIERLEAVQRLLNMFGINSVIYKNRTNKGVRLMPDGNGGQKEYECQAIHELVISNDSLFKFRDIIGFFDNDKIDKLNNLLSQYKRTPNKTKFLSKINSITPIGRKFVYDCTIPGIHSFNANGIQISNCSEIPLEPFELCNLSEVFPTRCFNNNNLDEKRFYEALKYATFYSSTISLIPTHWPITNEVVARNRRIGVSLSGIADLYDLIGFSELTRLCRAGYKVVREENLKLAKEAGVPPSLRVTTIKPSGSISLLAGVSPGMHFPTFRYAIRRMRISTTSELIPYLKKSGYKWEKDSYSDNTLVFEFPINQGNTRSAEEVSMWEQFSLLAALQREWADNMVSATIYFNKGTEGNQIEHALAQHAPVIKSVSMLPHSKKGAYKQPPYEGITLEEYQKETAKIKKINWQKLSSDDSPMPKYCSNDICIN